MHLKLLFSVALAAVAAGWFAVAGSTAGFSAQSRSAALRAAAAAPQPELDLFSDRPRLGARATTGVTVSIPAGAPEAGKVTLYVPAGYGVDLAAWPGTHEGDAFMLMASDFAFGDLEAADPAAYVNTPQGQACAPGQHVAVWTMQLDGSTSFTVPIYIDPTSGAETALGAYKFQICLPLARLTSPGGWPMGSKLRMLGIAFSHMTNPSSPAVYVWRAFVSNPDASGNPDASTTYELRSDMPLPAKLTLTGSLDRKHHRALLRGQLTTQASSAGGIKVGLYRRTGFEWKYVGSTRTAANGSYRFASRNTRTTTYGTEIWSIGACNGVSTAPKGCVNETHGKIDSPDVRIVVHRRR
jgi:hypothetical protein